MSFSKKNLDQLKNLIEKNNLRDCSNNNYINRNLDVDLESTKTNDPNELFYSIIDNSENINDTTSINFTLKKSEEKNSYIHKRKEIFMTEEDLLYDQFKYLLEE